MLTREENDLVTQVGPGTPLGDTLRLTDLWTSVAPQVNTLSRGGGLPRRVRHVVRRPADQAPDRRAPRTTSRR